MEFVHVDEIVASAKIQLGINSGDLDLYPKKMAIEAEKEIRSGLTISDFHDIGLEVHGNKAKLPQNFVSLKEVLGYKENGAGKINPSYLPSTFYRCEKESPNLSPRTQDPKSTSPHGMTARNNSYGQSGGEFVQEHHPYTFQLQRGWIFFSDDCDFDYIDLGYKGYNADENGELLIPEHHERAIRAYLGYFYHLENNYSGAGTAQLYQNEWRLAKQQARGRDGTISRELAAFSRRILNSMLPPYRIQY